MEIQQEGAAGVEEAVDYQEDLGLSVVLADLPDSAPPCPLCADPHGLGLRNIRRLIMSFTGYKYELVVRLQCNTCKKYLERDATEDETTSLAFEAD